MKKILLLLSIITLSNLKAQTITRLIAASPFDDNLEIFDTATFNSVGSKTLTFSGGSFQGVNGLAKKPSTGVYYAVVNDGSGNRYLATLNPLTGVLTSVGLLGDNFSQITFNGNNTLLGVTGAGATVPCAVYRINTANAAKSLITSIANGIGQVICYNPSDNKVYQWYSSTPLRKSYDTSFVSNTVIPNYTGGAETIGGLYKTGNVFVTHDWNGDFRSTRSTNASTVSSSFTNHYFKGLAYVTCSRTITPSSQVVCGNTSSITLVMSGTSGATYQWLKNGVAISGATLSTLNTSATGTGYYKCRIEDGCGMDTLAPGVTLSVAPLPLVSISGPTVACSGAQVTLTASSGGTSQWYRNGALISGATSNTYIPTTAGKYNMIKTNTNGCRDSAAVGLNLILANSPTLTVNSGSVCAGKSFTITASGANTYTFSGGNIVSPTTTTTYSVSGTGTNGCVSAPALVNITVSPSPSLLTIFSSTLLCSGGSVTLTASGAGTITWNNGVINGTAFTPTITNTYSVTCTNAIGCTSMAAITVSVTDCTGIEKQIDKQNQFQIFPNPNSGQFVVKSIGDYHLQIMNEIGQVIIESELDADNQHTLELKGLSAGIYFMVFNNAIQTITTKIIVTK